MSSTDAIECGQGLGLNDNSEEVLIADVSFDKAKEQEIENWSRNGVYTVVKDEGQKTISTRWIYSLKSTPNGTMQKAQLVVRGFEEDCLNDLEKASPTCSKEAVHVDDFMRSGCKEFEERVVTKLREIF